MFARHRIKPCRRSEVVRYGFNYPTLHLNDLKFSVSMRDWKLTANVEQMPVVGSQELDWVAGLWPLVEPLYLQGDDY